MPLFNEVGRDASRDLLEPGEDFLHAVAVDRGGVARMRTGKFGRRPLLYFQPAEGKELRLLTVSSDPAPFVAAFEAARVQ